MSKYLVRLKPIENFFFGNERSFGYDNEDKSYIVKSNFLPQQTSILGMLRKEVLVKSDKLNDNYKYSAIEKEENEKLIGAKSFDIGSNEQNFGVIKEISPIFIANGEDYYMKIPKDHKKADKEKVYTVYTPLTISGQTINTSIGSVALPIDYDGKKGISEDFINIKSKAIIAIDKIFKENERVGIEKGKGGKTEENAYYKIVSYKLLDNFEFVFVADINMEFHNWTNIVTVGGEGSSFRISFKSIEKSFIDEINLSNGADCYTKIILLSDTYIKDDMYEYCNFAISKSVDFRNMETQINHDSKYRNDNKRFKKNNKKYRLLERGSILYTSNFERLEEKINSYKNLKKIGYNVFIKG